MSEKDKKMNLKDDVEINDSSLKDVAGGEGISISQSYSQGKISVSLPPPPPGREEAFRKYKKELEAAGIEVES